MDRFLGGTFLTFGIEVISFALRDEEDRVDPVIYIFPRMTKCTFHKFGTSGDIERETWLARQEALVNMFRYLGKAQHHDERSRRTT